MPPPLGSPPPHRAARCWTLLGPEGGVDVEVTAREEETVGDVMIALSRSLGLPGEGLWSGSTRLPDALPLTAPELAHGAVLGLGRTVASRREGSSSSALELHVVGGPDAGGSRSLGMGRHLLGRGSEATVQIDDPDVSRRHAVVEVGGGGITVADLGSTNGSRLAGSALDLVGRPWPTGVVLRIGASALTVTGPTGSSATVDSAPGGRLRLRRPPRMHAPAPQPEVCFPSAPAEPPRRRLAWLPLTLPAVGGLLMAWWMRTPTFLFFALLSPLMAVASWWSDRWSGRRGVRREAAAYAHAVQAAESRLREALDAAADAQHRAYPDLATLSTAARRHGRLLWSRTGADDDGLTIRVGAGTGPTRVIRVEGDGTRSPVSAEGVPVVLDLRGTRGLGVVGPRAQALRVLSAVVTQLTALHAPGEVDVALLLSPEARQDWEWARWLPHLDPAAVHVGTVAPRGTAETHSGDSLTRWLHELLKPRGADHDGQQDAPGERRRWLVIVVDGSVDPRTAASLHAVGAARVLCLTCGETPGSLPVAPDAILRLSGETGNVAVLSRQGAADRDGIQVDGIAPDVAVEVARNLARLVPAASASALPRSVRLLDLPMPGVHVDDDGHPRGTWSRSRSSLVATLGRTTEGSVQVDLCRSGPHALVAGTTGSGKSELLQTLIAGLALSHPPDRCSFLLVDYKGGAAFAEAASLPHTVGVVTDLDGQTTVRALRSLTAELLRREALLAERGVRDIGDLPEDVPLARLVIVVDEFATLAEELPAFVPGLISIAQRGRSLGVHLVLATQRPSGVVSPEIRANCSLRICLRTTDEAESRDVLGTTDAAHLPVDAPGRAYLRVGSSAPVPFQVARVAGAPPLGEELAPTVRRWAWPAAPSSLTPQDRVDGDSDLVRLTRAVARHAGDTACGTPHRPWRPPLPDRLPVTSVADDSSAEPRGRLAIGLVDLPDRQTQEPLELDLDDGGAWIVVGGPRSGRTTTLRTILREAVHRLGPEALHVHVLESGGGALAAEAGRLPHTGTAIAGEDALRTVRLVDRLAREVTARRAGSRPKDCPSILLLIDGIESVSELLDAADPALGAAGLLRLIRDGAAVGVTCVLTADRALPGGRLAAVATQRLVLPLPDRADYAVAGIPLRAVPSARPPGRALVGEDAMECQLALARPEIRDWEAAAGTPPLRIAELPADPTLPLPIGSRLPDAAGTTALRLPIGIGGDEADVLELDLQRTGGLLVAGPPASGRSAALDAFAEHLAAVGTPVLRIGRTSAAQRSSADWLAPTDEAGVQSWLAGLDGRYGVVLADDVGAPAESPALSRLPAFGPGSGVVLVAVATPAELSTHYQGPVAALRRNRTALLLCPGQGDAELLGIRLPRCALPLRPGCGWLVTPSGPERIQVARRRLAEP